MWSCNDSDQVTESTVPEQTCNWGFISFCEHRNMCEKFVQNWKIKRRKSSKMHLRLTVDKAICKDHGTKSGNGKRKSTRCFFFEDSQGQSKKSLFDLVSLQRRQLDRLLYGLAGPIAINCRLPMKSSLDPATWKVLDVDYSSFPRFECSIGYGSGVFRQDSRSVSTLSYIVISFFWWFVGFLLDIVVLAKSSKLAVKSGSCFQLSIFV